MIVNNDVFSATYFARNCIRAVWEEHVLRSERSIHDIMFDDGQSHQIKGNASSESHRTVEAYATLMEERQRINSNRRELQAITWKFRLRDTDYLSENDEELKHVITAERSVWNFLEERFQGMEDILSGHMKMYSIRATMEETEQAKIQSLQSFNQTEAANRMARSSGQLTKIATVVVPCTFVASIFSMNGEFAAGESLFYIYWAISVPVTFGLLIWVIHEDILKGLKDRKSWSSPSWVSLQSWKRSKEATTVMPEKLEV
jgi:Mg2+ and Co2+ transporter CorA